MNAPSSFRGLRAEREEEWRRLDALVSLCEKKSPRALSDDDLMALPILYRSALSSLSVARETSLDLELVTYLEHLCARAYFFLYGVRTSPGARLRQFFANDWPAAVRGLGRETLIALALLLVGTIAGYLLVSSQPEYFSAFVPGELANGRDFSASRETLLNSLYSGKEQDGLAVFATYLFTHNAQVAIFCFALGFAFGIPTALLLAYTGAMLGAFLALYGGHGLGLQLGGWLIIHGSTELFAIVLAGAGGLRIGWSVVFPGAASRLAAASVAGRGAATAMVGVVLMLIAAGLLEGFGRQLIVDDAVRYAIGLTMMLLWLVYFYAPRRRRNG
ncbi:stage II sporulation protein M [Sphingosinicella sp. BN140058]|uniref:stage II sporulation protein M n=1 Tax=Sphingosinicella sp. BN140058 TaxID=1892855 RepID=UPI001012722E|nr:stage II sporulation protein M [Sphingosinicella sp. BN140058]QAY78582.1 stage II sporulation protein M [Sphingosinicella sp. BN140058]